MMTIHRPHEVHQTPNHQSCSFRRRGVRICPPSLPRQACKRVGQPPGVARRELEAAWELERRSYAALFCLESASVTVTLGGRILDVRDPGPAIATAVLDKVIAKHWLTVRRHGIGTDAFQEMTRLRERQHTIRQQHTLVSFVLKYDL